MKSILGAVLLSIVTGLAWGYFRIGWMVQAEAERMGKGAGRPLGSVIADKELVDLPGPVQKYLRASGVVGKPRLWYARMRWRGQFRLHPSEPFAPLWATQYARTLPLSRVWSGIALVKKFLPVYARDLYSQGESNTLVSVLGIYHLSDESGTKVAQSALVSCLNDMVLLPTELLDKQIHWEAIDGRSARATLTAAGTSASATYVFNDKGEIVDFVSEDRYRDTEAGMVKTRWSSPFRNHQKWKGFHIPTEREAIWHLPEGDFSYEKALLMDLEFNNPLPY